MKMLEARKLTLKDDFNDEWLTVQGETVQSVISEAAHFAIDRFVRYKEDCDVKWNYHGSLFFAATTASAIGYGTSVPTTEKGRAFCVLFAIVGMILTQIRLKCNNL